VADGLGVRSERLFEVVSNVHHLATASLEDVLDLAAALDVSPRDLLFARPPRRIGTVEDAALQAYAEHIGIPLVEILRLRRAAEEHADDLALVVPADWAQLASRIGDAVQG
jgi:hypothetical protein